MLSKLITSHIWVLTNCISDNFLFKNYIHKELFHLGTENFSFLFQDLSDRNTTIDFYGQLVMEAYVSSGFRSSPVQFLWLVRNQLNLFLEATDSMRWKCTSWWAVEIGPCKILALFLLDQFRPPTLFVFQEVSLLKEICDLFSLLENFL